MEFHTSYLVSAHCIFIIVVVFVAVIVVLVFIVPVRNIVVFLVIVVVVVADQIDIRNNKSDSKPAVFDTFEFQMCLAPQQKAFFSISTCQRIIEKWHEPDVF